MTRGLLTYVITTGLILSLSALVPSGALAADTTCPSGGVPAPGSSIDGRLTVDGDCVLTNVTITGGVLITGVGHLTIYGSTLNGGVSVQANGEFDSNVPPQAGGANTIQGGVNFDHGLDLDIKGGTVFGPVTLNGISRRGVILSLCDATFHGSLTIENMPFSFNIPRLFSGVGAGDPGEFDFAPDCGPNVFDGHVFILNSPQSRIELEGNTITGSVVVDNSQASLSGNTISGSLSCRNGGLLTTYDADDTRTVFSSLNRKTVVGSPNTVNGSNSCPAVSVLSPADDDPPGTPLIENGPGPGIFDEEAAADRAAAYAERFGDFASESRKEALLADGMQQAALFGTQLPGSTPPTGMPVWRSLGPTQAKYQTNGLTFKISDSGRVRRVLQDPANDDTVYVLTSGGGLWKTTRFSHVNPRWDAKTDALLTTSGGNMAFGRDARTLYLGMGDPFDAVPTLSGVMAKSTDGGDTWSPLVSLVGANNVRDVQVDTSSATDIVLVAADGGLYRSADAGSTYAQVLAPPTPTMRFFLTSIGFWSLARTSAGWLVSGADGTIFRSTNEGATWTPIPGAIAGAGRTTLGVAAAGDAVVYAFAATSGDIAQLDLFRSSDGGLSWTALGLGSKTPTNPNFFQRNMNLMGGQAFYNQMILVDPADPSRNTIYLGGQLSTAKSTDGGATWTLISVWLPGFVSPSLPYVHADHHAASTVKVKGLPGIIFGTDGGIFLSTDGGNSFSFDKNDGIVSFLAQTVMSSTKNPQDFAIGLQDTGTRARLGASSVFNQVTGGDGEGIGWSQANNAVTLTTAAFGTIFHSEGLLPNTIGTFRFVSPRSRAGDRPLFFTPIATPDAPVDPSGLIFLTATSKRVFVTFDGGQRGASWFVLARAGGRLPSSFTVRDTQHIIGLDADPAFNRVAVGGFGAQIAFTLDGGLAWTTQTLSALVPGFAGFISSPAWTASGTLYVAAENPFPGAIRAVKTSNNGASWQRADFGLPDAPVFHIVVDPRDRAGGTLFAATDLGVYRTSDGGQSWSRFGAGLPAVVVQGLWIASDGSLLRAASFGRGAWEINP